MSGGIKLFGHSVHPILIVFPLGLLAASTFFEIFYYITGRPEFSVVTFWLIVGGLIGGAVAAPFGWLDWFAIPSGTRAKSVGLAHGSVFVGVLLLFAISCYLRWGLSVAPSPAATVFLVCGFLLASVGGWLGGELVERLGISVHDGANPDAPSSLSTNAPISHSK